jgi:hypothetical protein
MKKSTSTRPTYTRSRTPGGLPRIVSDDKEFMGMGHSYGFFERSQASIGAVHITINNPTFVTAAPVSMPMTSIVTTHPETKPETKYEVSVARNNAPTEEKPKKFSCWDYICCRKC